jgi:hypothetical protein
MLKLIKGWKVFLLFVVLGARIFVSSAGMGKRAGVKQAVILFGTAFKENHYSGLLPGNDAEKRAVVFHIPGKIPNRKLL